MGTRILIIEDNPANLELMGYLLQAFGHETLSARDGQQGLLKAECEMPHLIMCDIQMPKMDGYEVAKSLKSNPALRHIPLVAVTALAMVGDRDKVLAAMFDGYLTKPVVPETFVQQVEQFLPAGLRSAPAPPPDTTAADTPASRAVPRAADRTALVVDNLPSNLDFACSVLEHYGFKSITARSMHGALALARRTPPDLILSDINMEGGSGYDFITAVKADVRLKSIPFIFLTSTMTNEREREKGLALGAARFLFRPIEPQVLLDEIGACLSEGKNSESGLRQR